MKLSVVLLIVGLAGVSASVAALQTSRSERAHEAQTTYYANGQLQSETEYDDGRRDGHCRRWYADGKLMAEGNFASGRMDGAWQWWLPDGSVDAARSGQYTAGVRQAD